MDEGAPRWTSGSADVSSHRHSINVAGDTGWIPQILRIGYLGPICARIPVPGALLHGSAVRAH